MAQLDNITIKGFKSIKELNSFPLNNINILIGKNGSGKSNFIEVFKFLRATMQLPLPGFPTIDLKNMFKIMVQLKIFFIMGLIQKKELN